MCVATVPCAGEERVRKDRAAPVERISIVMTSPVINEYMLAPESTTYLYNEEVLGLTCTRVNLRFLLKENNVGNLQR